MTKQKAVAKKADEVARGRFTHDQTETMKANEEKKIAELMAQLEHANHQLGILNTEMAEFKGTREAALEKVRQEARM